MSLYLKHRPKEWAQIAGNKATVEVLQNMISKPEHPHVYLFVGGTGCGKTTVARILAEKLGCVGEDLREVNSADFRGIDSVRDIIQQSKYMALEGSCRGWIIDECHKMTNDAQNAFLKILEDTPKHVYFFLCTTDPQKLLATIKSRSSVFTLNQLTDDEMFGLLRRVAKREKASVEEDVLRQIVQDALGHPRAALQVLEHILNVEPDKRMEVAQQKAAELNEIIELCRALLSGKDWKTVSKILNGIKNQEPESIRRVVLGYAQAILLNGKADDRAGLILETFMEPFFNSGFPQVVYCCYSVVRN